MIANVGEMNIVQKTIQNAQSESKIKDAVTQKTDKAHRIYIFSFFLVI